MKLKIIGSGGCVSIPRPCCQCKVCTEAREKGFPYARTGCSLFIEEGKVLIDTPEDVGYALNNANIDEVKYIMYSHKDPDHTMGMRIIEQLKINWLNISLGIKCDDPVKLVSTPTVLEEVRKQATKYGSMLDYYVSRGLVTLEAARNLQVDDVNIDMVPVDESETVSIFIITQNDKKIIYAPCDVKPFPDNEKFADADILIIGDTIVGEVLKNGFILEKDNPLRNELFIMDEVMQIKEKYNIDQIVITHIEEDWGKSYDDYLELEKTYDHVSFAYDGMEIEI